MEIYSLRSVGNLLYKNETKNQREQTSGSTSSPLVRPPASIERFEEVLSAYSSMTPRQLREMALQGFEQGQIDQDTYTQLASELPMEAIDPQGRILDFSTVTDDTPFNFHEYYKSQLEIARNLGDERSVSILKAAVDFLET